jgi:hypothetical protein
LVYSKEIDFWEQRHIPEEQSIVKSTNCIRYYQQAASSLTQSTDSLFGKPNNISSCEPYLRASARGTGQLKEFSKIIVISISWSRNLRFMSFDYGRIRFNYGCDNMAPEGIWRSDHNAHLLLCMKPWTRRRIVASLQWFFFLNFFNLLWFSRRRSRNLFRMLV